MDSDTLFRMATPADWPEIISIYNQGIEDGFNAFTRPITLAGYRKWLTLHDGKSYAIFVAVSERRVAGWCSLSPYRHERKAFRNTGEIIYYFDREFRWKGIGSRLVCHAIEQAPLLGLTTLLAFLLDTNQPSIQLLEKTGFTRWGHFHDIAVVHGAVCGQLVYGKKVSLPERDA